MRLSQSPRGQIRLLSHEKGRKRWLHWSLLLLGVVGAGLLIWSFSSTPEEVPTHAARNKRMEPPQWSEEEFNDSTAGITFEEVSDEELNIEEVDADPLHVLAKLKSNQTLFKALRKHGLVSERIQPMVTAMSAVFDFRRSRPGDEYEARLDLDGNILEFRYQTSPEHIYTARLIGDRYVAERVRVPKHMQLERVDGKLLMNSSLYQSMTAVGEDADVARRFMDLFSHDFDFGNDSRPGDRFRLLVEKVYLKGEFYKYGRILAAEYKSGDTTLATYLFDPDESDDTRSGYYDERGQNMRRLFIKMPVKGARLTSGFTMRRFHPVYKRYRPHLGVDYAAPTGTPIQAIADGEITFRGSKGGNGNLVIIKHDNGYESLYAHLSAFSPRHKQGDTVEQKDIIGYVGTTGASTGPHLHLGVRKHGTYVDPLSIDSSRGAPLRGRHLRQFQQSREQYQGMLDGELPLPSRQDLTAGGPATTEDATRAQ